MEKVYIPLESIQIANPCRADWDGMTGDERARLCGSCHKHVYNLSSMTRAEAEALIVEKEGKFCARIYRREDGTVITSDCPVGITPPRRPQGWFAAALAAVLSGLLGLAGRPALAGPFAVQTGSSPPKMLMGDVAYTPTPGPTSLPRPVATPVPSKKPAPAARKKIAVNSRNRRLGK